MKNVVAVWRQSINQSMHIESEKIGSPTQRGRRRVEGKLEITMKYSRSHSGVALHPSNGLSSMYSKVGTRVVARSSNYKYPQWTSSKGHERGGGDRPSVLRSTPAPQPSPPRTRRRAVNVRFFFLAGGVLIDFFFFAQEG